MSPKNSTTNHKGPSNFIKTPNHDVNAYKLKKIHHVKSHSFNPKLLKFENFVSKNKLIPKNDELSYEDDLTENDIDKTIEKVVN